MTVTAALPFKRGSWRRPAAQGLTQGVPPQAFEYDTFVHGQTGASIDTIIHHEIYSKPGEQPSILCLNFPDFDGGKTWIINFFAGKLY